MCCVQTRNLGCQCLMSETTIFRATRSRRRPCCTWTLFCVATFFALALSPSLRGEVLGPVHLALPWQCHTIQTTLRCQWMQCLAIGPDPWVSCMLGSRRASCRSPARYRYVTSRSRESTGGTWYVKDWFLVEMKIPVVFIRPYM